MRAEADAKTLDEVPVWRAALRRLEGAYAPNTLRELERHARDFDSWCAERGVCAIPAEPQTIAGHVAAISPRYSTRTVEIRLMAIRRLHQLLDLPDPTRTFGVKLAYRLGRRQFGGPPRQTQGLTADVRNRLLEACPDTLMGLRDRTLVGLGYDTLCRRSELVNLRVEDIQRLPDGMGEIPVGPIKTASARRGQIAFISRRTMLDLDAWLAAANLTSGPILRRFYHSAPGKRLAKCSVGKRLKALAKLAGLPPEVAAGYTGHSMRVGAAQDLATAGRSLVEIMRAGRWQHLDAVALYVREARVNVWAGSDGDTFPATRAAGAARGPRRRGKRALTSS